MIEVWLASVMVGSDAIAPWPNAAPIVDDARHVRSLTACGHVVEHVRVGAVEQEADHVAGRSDASRGRAGLAVLHGDVAVRRPPAVGASGAQPRNAATVGAASTRRIDRGATPSPSRPSRRSRTVPGPARSPSEPCSPRWPPWSSQLWRAEWITHRSGVAGESNSWATESNGCGYWLSARRGCLCARSASRPANLSVPWSASGLRPSVATTS